MVLTEEVSVEKLRQVETLSSEFRKIETEILVREAIVPSLHVSRSETEDSALSS